MLLLTLAVALELLADYALKRWALSSAHAWAASGAILYGLSGLSWGFFLRQCTLQRAVVLFAVSNVLGALLIGRVCFGEHLTPLDQCAAALSVVVLVMVGGR